MSPKIGRSEELLGINSLFKIIQLDLLFSGRIPSFKYTTIYELTMQSVMVNDTYSILDLNKRTRHAFTFQFLDFPVQKFFIQYCYDAYAYYVVFIIYVLVYLIVTTFSTLLNEMWTTQIKIIETSIKTSSFLWLFLDKSLSCE